MAQLLAKLELDRCPHCSVDKPNLNKMWGNAATTTHSGTNKRFWATYQCSSCGSIVLAMSLQDNGYVQNIYPINLIVNESIPTPARDFLQQAIDSLHAPAGAIMLTASSVDAMLKEKGYTEGSLNHRINEAEKDNLITKEMSDWAHNVRIDANEPRHADEGKPLPSPEDAERCIEFTLALGEFLFVLPDKVQRGLKKSSEDLESKEA